MHLNNHLINETEEIAKHLKISKAKYIRMAVEPMNQEILLKKYKKLENASLLIREESLLVNKEFSKIEHDSKI